MGFKVRCGTMNKEDLLKELRNMTALQLGERLINPALTNKQRQEICRLWYSIRKNDSKSEKKQ
jgi:hypothetical protein